MKFTLTHILLSVSVLTSANIYAGCVTGVSKFDSIYVDHGNGTVTDAETGLMWQKCSLGLSGAACTTGTATKYTWKAALEAAQTANAGEGTYGYADWRLPSIVELDTLIEKACFLPSINSTLFPATVSDWYWTSTPSISNATNAWTIHFGSGNSTNIKSNNYYVRLVREDL